jgi:hypothetical protein
MRCSQRLGDLGGLEGLGGFGPPAFFLAFFCIRLCNLIRTVSHSQLAFWGSVLYYIII